MSKTHWKKLLNPDYIGAYWLNDGEDATVVIDYVQNEEIIGTGGKKEFCSVAHLRGDVKPMILNSTNSKTIAALYGNFVEDWAGKPITLYASTTKFGGNMVDCLRIRPLVPKRQIAEITPERFSTALKAIQSGTYNAEALRTRFALTQEQNDALDAALVEMAEGGPPGAVDTSAPQDQTESDDPDDETVDDEESQNA